MRQLQKKTGPATSSGWWSIPHHPAAANEFIREYVRRLKGGAYEPLHPLLDEILAETFGIMTYQEDVCKTAMRCRVRRSGRRRPAQGALEEAQGEEAGRVLRTVYAGAAARGVERATVDKVWDMIMSFSGYSFCKPHSASYALVSFKSAWLRAHHPAEFMAR